jgi:hypothetical protein
VRFNVQGSEVHSPPAVSEVQSNPEPRTLNSEPRTRNPLLYI